MQLPFLYGRRAYAPSGNSSAADKNLMSSLDENIVTINQLSQSSSDITIRRFEAFGLNLCMLLVEGMVASDNLANFLIKPLKAADLHNPTPEAFREYMNQKAVLASDQKEFRSFTELFRFIMSGFVVILCDGLESGFAMGTQGFAYRSVSEPLGEFNVRGSRESFVEAMRINMSMVRRRMKTPLLKMDLITGGESAKTDICLIYRTDKVESGVVAEIKNRIAAANIDTILESGYIQPFLENEKFSLFASVGITERPDTLCAKVAEGRVAIMVDGTPFALTIPHLFSEYFQGFDDYTHPTYYVTMIRLLRYLAFFITIALPGLYVAIVQYHLELLPKALLYNIAAAEEVIPFSPMLEVLIITLIYEVVREAGLRMPQPVGMAVSVVGALVVGDAAVKAGIIGAPMVMVVALTAVSAFLVPHLYQAITSLRLMIVIIGGLFGLFGIMLAGILVGINLFAMESGGIPITTPIAPLSPYGLRDVFTRASWKTLASKSLNVQGLKQGGR